MIPAALSLITSFFFFLKLIISIACSLIGRIYFLFFSIQNIKNNCSIIFLNFSPIFFSWWKIYSFPVIFIYKRFNFCFSLQIFFLFLHDLTRLLKCIESIDYLFLLIEFIVAFCFLSNQENLYVIHHNLDLFYDIYNTINEHN